MKKAISRIGALLAFSILAFRAVGSFLSWIERQEDSTAEAWIDEDEFEDA
ncbi:unannotated protein [freshwater metagenome]|uniref:Unannotated protein n=1 Tax=freshwater metagenome TaxID=449393 RepID=A0A6J7XQI3_9ZZZZ